MSEFPWTIRFCSGLGLQYMLLDSNGDIIALGEFYDESDMLAFIRVFMRNIEIRIDSKSLDDLKDRRQREAIRQELLLEERKRVQGRTSRRKKQGSPARTDGSEGDRGSTESAP